jgi:hypothetical protein
VEKCYAGNGGEVLHNVQLFPNKIPNNSSGCFMSALVPNIEPHSVGVFNDTVPTRVSFQFRRILIEYLMHVAETLDLTLRLSSITQSIRDLQTLGYCTSPQPVHQ